MTKAKDRMNRIKRMGLAALASLALAGTVRAATTTVYFPMQSFTGTAQNRRVFVTPAVNPITDGTNIIAGMPITLQPTNGFATNQFVASVYWITVEGVQTAIQMTVTNAAAQLNAVWLCTNLSQFVYAPAGPGVLVAAGTNAVGYTNGGTIVIAAVVSPQSVTNTTLAEIALNPSNWVSSGTASNIGAFEASINQQGNVLTNVAGLTASNSLPNRVSFNLNSMLTIFDYQAGHFLFSGFPILLDHGISSPGAGLNSEYYGQGASAAGSSGTAVGYGASASATDATAIGSGAMASANNGTALGLSSSAGAIDSTAVGVLANAGNTHSTALGKFATTDAANQVMLGTTNDTVVAPSNAVVRGIATINASANVGGLLSVTGQITGASLTVNNGLTGTVHVATGAGFFGNGLNVSNVPSVLNLTNQTAFNFTYGNDFGDLISDSGTYGVNSFISSVTNVLSTNNPNELVATNGVTQVNGLWGTNVFDPNGSYTNGMPGFFYTHTSTNGSFVTVVYSNFSSIIYKSKAAWPAINSALTAVSPATGSVSFRYEANNVTNVTPTMNIVGTTGGGQPQYSFNGRLWGDGLGLDMGPMILQRYPSWGNTHHVTGFGSCNPVLYDGANSGVVRHIWFTGTGTTVSSWYWRTNVELRIYTDFGTTSGTNPPSQYLNFRAPIGVLLGSTYQATNQPFTIVKETRYLRTIENSVPDGSKFSYYSFGLDMAAPYTNGVWVVLYDQVGQTNLQFGYSEVDWQNNPPNWPYMNWRLRSFSTNGIFGDPSCAPTNSLPPFLASTNVPGMLCGLMISAQRPTVNEYIFEGAWQINFQNGESWTWTGAEDLFGFAWEVQAGQKWGFTNSVGNNGFPPMTNSGTVLYPSTFRDFGVTVAQGLGVSTNAAIEAYRFWGQDAVCWTNGAVGTWTMNSGPGGGCINNFPANILSIFYSP